MKAKEVLPEWINDNVADEEGEHDGLFTKSDMISFAEDFHEFASDEENAELKEAKLIIEKERKATDELGKVVSVFMDELKEAKEITETLLLEHKKLLADYSDSCLVGGIELFYRYDAFVKEIEDKLKQPH